MFMYLGLVSIFISIYEEFMNILNIGVYECVIDLIFLMIEFMNINFICAFKGFCYVNVML